MDPVGHKMTRDISSFKGTEDSIWQLPELQAKKFAGEKEASNKSPKSNFAK